MKNSVYSLVRTFPGVQTSLICTVLIPFVFCTIAIADSSQDSSYKDFFSEGLKLTYSAFITALFLLLTTLVTYKLFIKNYLMEVECYKQRLAIYGEIYKKVIKMKALIEGLKSTTTETEKENFLKRYNSFIERRDNLFLSENVQNQLDRTIKAFEQYLLPRTYPDPPETLNYSETSLSYVEQAFELLRQTIKTEINNKMKSLK